MGNSCKRVKKDEKAKTHYKTKNKGKKDEFDTNNIQEQKNTVDIKKEIKEDEKKVINQDKIEEKIEDKKLVINQENIINDNIIEDIREEKKEEKKDEKKNSKIKEEKEVINIEEIDNFSEEECTCNLRLEIILEKVSNNNKYWIELYEYKNSRQGNKKKMGETESKSCLANKNIRFEKSFIIPFHFSQVQHLDFQINNITDSINYTISKTLGEIVGSLRQTYRKTFGNGIIFEVKAILNDELNKQCSFNIEISGALVGMKIGYLITSLGNQYDPINNLVYESEISSNNSSITYNESLIPMNELAVDENLDDNMIEIAFKDVAHSVELGKYQSSINQLFENKIDFDLKGNKKANIICKKKNFYSLLDYLERDLHLITTVFIDFSESKEENAHHLKNKDTTVLEQLMSNFIDLLIPYNEDTFFRIYGYGFNFKDKIIGDYDPNMFPINKKNDSPAIVNTDIHKFYNEFLKSINFGKQKTDISLILKKYNEIIKEDLDEDDIKEYNILLLFANYDIINEKELVKELILSSNLPASIIIVGLGKGPFSKLESLENNFMDLTDDEGNKAKRKCVKFVSFNKCLKNIQITVKNSLINIPDEVIEYLTFKNIVPN